MCACGGGTDIENDAYATDSDAFPQKRAIRHDIFGQINNIEIRESRCHDCFYLVQKPQLQGLHIALFVVFKLRTILYF